MPKAEVREALCVLFCRETDMIAGRDVRRTGPQARRQTHGRRGILLPRHLYAVVNRRFGQGPRDVHKGQFEDGASAILDVVRRSSDDGRSTPDFESARATADHVAAKPDNLSDLETWQGWTVDRRR